jgi:putative copper resistance protein D
VGEVVEVFRPKLPSLHTPSVDIMRANRAEAAARGERSRDAYLWSNYSHNVAGLILLGMSLVALVGSVVRPGGGRHWPLGFVALAAFVYLRAAANEGTWPFGTVPLWHIDAEGIQHRIAALLVLALGALEWRARARRDRASPDGRASSATCSPHWQRPARCCSSRTRTPPSRASRASSCR